MNKDQRKVVIAVGVITVLMFIFPPDRSLGYCLIGYMGDSNLDFYRYCVNWMTLITLGTVLYIWFKDKPLYDDSHVKLHTQMRDNRTDDSLKQTEPESTQKYNSRDGGMRRPR